MWKVQYNSTKRQVATFSKTLIQAASNCVGYRVINIAHIDHLKRFVWHCVFGTVFLWHYICLALYLFCTVFVWHCIFGTVFFDTVFVWHCIFWHCICLVLYLFGTVFVWHCLCLALYLFGTVFVWHYIFLLLYFWHCIFGTVFVWHCICFWCSKKNMENYERYQLEATIMIYYDK